MEPLLIVYYVCRIVSIVCLTCMFLRAAWIFIGIIENSDSPAGAYTSLSFYDWERRYAILQFLIAGVFVLTMEISHLLVASMEESNVVVAGLIIFSSMYGFWLFLCCIAAIDLRSRTSCCRIVFVSLKLRRGDCYKQTNVTA